MGWTGCCHKLGIAGAAASGIDVVKIRRRMVKKGRGEGRIPKMDMSG